MLLSPLLAQDEERARPAVEIPDFSSLDELLIEPKYTVSLSLRYVGRTQAIIRGLGTIASAHEATDVVSDVTRTYDDGFVGVDARVDGDGNRIADDGRTNTWSFRNSSQITPDESSVVFNTYSTTSEGAIVAARAKPAVGADVEFSREVRKFGGRSEERRTFAWGAVWGFGVSDVNAKASDTIRAQLNTLTDTYSLLGAAPPTLTEVDADANGSPDRDGQGNIITNGYVAPSSTTETVTNADGTTTSYTIDTTVLLANRPDSRTETSEPGAAQIDGIWQIKGAALSLRAGPFLRWQPREHFALRLSAGGTLSLLGLSMRYDERLRMENLNAPVMENESSATSTFTVGGLFGGVDLEWWLTERTGFFGAGYYEDYSKSAELSSGGRTGEIKFTGGLGVRAGLTYRF